MSPDFRWKNPKKDYFYENQLKLDGIEAFLTFPKMHSDYHGHATTWDCAVMGFANQSELRKIRKGLNLAPLESRGLKRRGFLSNVDGVPGIHGRVIPFPGSDSSIVRRSQSYLTRTESKITPVRFNIYCLIQEGFQVDVFSSTSDWLKKNSWKLIVDNLKCIKINNWWIDFRNFDKIFIWTKTSYQGKFELEVIGRGWPFWTKGQ